MSRKKKETTPELVAPEMPEVVTKMGKDDSISKDMLIKILSDLIRGEKARYSRQMTDLSRIAAEMAIMKAQIEKRRIPDKLIFQKFKSVEDELEEMGNRMLECESNIDTVFTAYNAIEPWAKKKKFDTIYKWSVIYDDDKAEGDQARNQPAEETDDDWPEDGMVDCDTCVWCIDAYNQQNGNHSKCCNSNATFYKQYVGDSKVYCSYYNMAGRNTSSAETTHSRLLYPHQNCRGGYYYDTLRHTPEPIFYAESLIGGTKEEFLCKKD